MSPGALPAVGKGAADLFQGRPGRRECPSVGAPPFWLLSWSWGAAAQFHLDLYRGLGGGGVPALCISPPAHFPIPHPHLTLRKEMLHLNELERG